MKLDEGGFTLLDEGGYALLDESGLFVPTELTRDFYLTSEVTQVGGGLGWAYGELVYYIGGDIWMPLELPLEARVIFTEGSDTVSVTLTYGPSMTVSFTEGGDTVAISATFSDGSGDVDMALAWVEDGDLIEAVLDFAGRTFGNTGNLNNRSVSASPTKRMRASRATFWVR